MVPEMTCFCFRNNFAFGYTNATFCPQTFVDGCGESAAGKNGSRKDGSSFAKRRASDGNNPTSPDFAPRSRPSSFHDVELTPVPEVTISPDEECVESEESSRSASPSSRVSFQFMTILRFKRKATAVPSFGVLKSEGTFLLSQIGCTITWDSQTYGMASNERGREWNFL